MPFFSFSPTRSTLVYRNSFANDEHFPRFFDPIFAVCVGISAAALRIRREEKEKYPDQNNDYRSLWAKGLRMGNGYFRGYRKEEK